MSYKRAVNNPKAEASAQSTEKQTSADPKPDAVVSKELTPELLQLAEEGGIEAVREALKSGATPSAAAPAPDAKPQAAPAPQVTDAPPAPPETAAAELTPEGEAPAAETEETPEEPPPAATPEVDEPEEKGIPKRIRLDSEKFTDTERHAARLVKEGVFSNLSEALTHLTAKATPATTTTTQRQDLPEAAELAAANQRVETLTKQLEDATKAADFDQQSKLFLELRKADRDVVVAERKAEAAQSWQRNFDTSAQRARVEYPEASRTDNAFGLAVMGRLANMAPNDPLANDPDQAFKVTQEVAKMLGIKARSEAAATPPAATAAVPATQPAKVPQPKKAPVPGSARTVVPTTQPEEEYTKRARELLGDEAHVLEALT